MSISIVMPVLNEANGIEAVLRPLQLLRGRGVELVVADGGSSDGTATLAARWADTVLSTARGRAGQMNAGAVRARGDLLLFLHADTLLPPDADRLIHAAVERGAAWGRFDVRISGRPWMLRVVARLINLRSRWSGIATGDQAIFITRLLFEQLGGFADQPLMEDIELCRRLKLLGLRPACVAARATTSGRRWEQRGVWRTIVLMWWLRWRYWRGAAPSELAKTYR
jgi:rSAM/selenodomain-associated transferase 2